MKIVINKYYRGLDLSDEAYEKLIEWGIPVRKYKDQQIDPGEVIFDRSLDEDGSSSGIAPGRYWECWTGNHRTHPLLVRVVEELGKAANGLCSALKIVDVPNDVSWHIEEHGGSEHVVEDHRTWS